ncbi:hypothetical protein HMPREF1624_00832 [Sporothrix schenckii ATCC 58251]|uniref:Uncharacterized protein n=1 Tax=Sporothrix schenckii (strain ATCC 58251 / de Perez 2211183) TaxID=1391915 RepID=U7Q5T4_SPOS1|nr:hypothetical protein HMPREF1624_00832 [Sporothrix schenckii ATCC 58251]
MAVPAAVEMDASSISATARLQRLGAIGADLGVHSPPPIAPLRKPLQPYSVRTPFDDDDAEKLLRQRRVAAEGQRPPTLMRAFTTSKRKEWTPAEIFAALEEHVGQGGSAALAESLVVKLTAVGGNVNVVDTKVKVNKLTRRRSIESLERSRLLQRAIELNNPDLVAVLVPYADPMTLDSALPAAIRSGHPEMVKHLLRYGAGVANTTAGLDAFRQLCSADANADLVGLLLASDGRPDASDLSLAMVDAATHGCIENAMRLSRSAADGNYDKAAALCAAVKSCRPDIALAIVTGMHPPHTSSVNGAFKLLFEHPTVLPNDKMALAEILLCAGAHGDIVAHHLAQSCITNFSAMASLLADYGASVEYNNAAVLRRSLAQKQLDLAKILFSEAVAVSPQLASKCITYLPKNVSNEERFELLLLLLRKGAGGARLNDYLIEVTAAGDVNSVRLLLTPFYPEHIDVGPPDDTRMAHRQPAIHQQHHTASVDHKEGAALRMAVQAVNFDMVAAMLYSRPQRPSPNTLAKAFPDIFHLPADQRYEMTDMFLRTGFSGPVITDTLQKAIQEPPQARDQRLISALLRANADINSSLISAVANGDVDLMQDLLHKGTPTKQALAAALSQTETLVDVHTRRQVVQLLLGAGVGDERAAVSELLIHTISQPALDMELVEMLLVQGEADINYNGGQAVALAASSPKNDILQRLLATKTANRDTLSHGLNCLSSHPSTAAKAIKLETLLRFADSDMKQQLDALLVSEVVISVKAPPQERIISVVQVLLAAGADVNAHNADALGHAVAAPVVQIVEMLLSRQPSQASLIKTIPRIFNITDAMDRLAVAKMLLQAGVPASEINVTLNHAVVHFPEDHPLIRTLASAADGNQGAALLSAVRSKTPDLVAVLLSAKAFDVEVLNSALYEVMTTPKTPTRLAMSKQILEAGATGSGVSDALVVAASDADLDLCDLLVSNDARADHNDSQAFIAACRSGASDVLQTLLKSRSEITPETLSRGFQEAGAVDDLNAREATFSLLLSHGVSGMVVDKELATSAGYGDDGVGLVRLLLQNGADTNYNDGEAIRTSTRHGFMATLKLLLDIVDDTGAITKKNHPAVGGPSQDTLARSLKISWMLKSELRYQIIQWLFAAGLQPTEAVHIALNKAVKEEKPNVGLIRLLLEHGASPVADGCQALVNAACRSRMEILELCTTLSTVSASHLGSALAGALDPSRANVWMTQEGLDTARLLFEKGAKSSDLGHVLALCVSECAGESDNSAIARQFVQLLVENGANVNINKGEPLQAAAKLGDAALVQQLLKLNPSAESKAMAFSYIFESGVSEDDIVRLIELFREERIQGAENGLDVLFEHPDRAPVLSLALSQYPRSVRILEALLDAGYYHDQLAAAHTTPDVDSDEPVTLLFWALLQPQKKISSAVIELLIERGSNINFVSSLSMTSPIMLAIQSQRADLVKSLIRAGADVDVADYNNHTPLIMAVQAGGTRAVEMMTDILELEPARNDGSLHLAAKTLNLAALKILVKNKHDVDFPCPEYDGRSALAEICQHGSDGAALAGSRLKALEQCMTFLLDHGSDIQLRSEGKTPLLLALEANDPVATTRALLKAGLYKYVNSPFNRFQQGNLVYSPTMYAQLVLQLPAAVRDQLVRVLKSNRAEDLYYARSGPQPPGAVSVPDELMEIERDRQARLERAQAEERDRALARRHAEELAELTERTQREEMRAMKERAEMEQQTVRQKAIAAAEAQVEAERIRAAGDVLVVQQRAAAEIEATNQRAHAELMASRRRAAADMEAMQARARQRESEHAAELNFKRQQGERMLELEDRKQRMLLTYEQQRSEDQVNAAQQVSSIQVAQRRQIDEYDHAQNRREMQRLTEGRKLASAIKQLPAGPQGRNSNVAGYIMGEVT